MIVTKELIKHITSLIRKCPKCGNTDGVIVLAGMGAKFFYCPICSPKQKAPEAEPEPKPELILEE